MKRKKLIEIQLKGAIDELECDYTSRTKGYVEALEWVLGEE